MTEDEAIKTIQTMSHEEMARIMRFAPAGSIYFIAYTPACEAFFARWRELGGWNSALSKQIGFAQ